MHVLISYDISENRARTRLHKFMKEFGLNTQKSVFECDLDKKGIERILNFARAELDKKSDTLRIYKICSGCQRKVIISGKGLKVVKLDFMIL